MTPSIKSVISAAAIFGAVALISYASYKKINPDETPASQEQTKGSQVRVGTLSIQTATINTIGKQEQIERLLKEAATDMTEFRLTTPNGNNAHDKYMQILQIEPDNKAARAGVQKIVNTYVDMVMTTLGRYDFAKAKRYLQRAITLSEEKAALQKLADQIEQLEKQYEQSSKR